MRMNLEKGWLYDPCRILLHRQILASILQAGPFQGGLQAHYITRYNIIITVHPERNMAMTPNRSFFPFPWYGTWASYKTRNGTKRNGTKRNGKDRQKCGLWCSEMRLLEASLALPTLYPKSRVSRVWSH